MSENQKNTTMKKYLDILLSGVKHIVCHNAILKVIAVLISVVLWAGLISQDESITRDKTFQNVNVSVTGTEVLKNNGYIVVSNLEEKLKDVSFVAEVPQKQYENAEASAYNLRLDLSRIKGTGEQEIKIQSTNSATYGKVISVNPSSITVDVEDYIIRQRIPVAAPFMEGEIPEGWYMVTNSVDPALVAVSGPKSVVQTISKAAATINMNEIEWSEKTFIDSYKIKMYNRTGEEVDSSLLSVTTSSLSIDSVVIELSLLPCEYYDTDDLVQISGTVAPGYRITGVKISPESIMVAARQEVLDQLADLSLEYNTVNVENLKETKGFQLKVLKPSENAVLSNDTVTVMVEIEEEPAQEPKE